MSTETSPSNRSRSKKISGGRVACIVYLPKEEVKEIDKEVDETDTSRSSVEMTPKEAPGPIEYLRIGQCRCELDKRSERGKEHAVQS
ncbi:hypothetical protein [Acinetobacter seifertii]|uniref:hypothetical protein n=1 Tax=Acinetobacter seifertii TaxID=1530123 RepID=UPI0032B480F6